ncbi:MAG TPA: MFS transporter [Burkholderiales bacterium]|nr:MFS transporter [Burkholderiales bacterium]
MPPAPQPTRSSSSALHRLVARAVPVAPAELSALLWSFAYFFLLLAGYYVLRPLRDQMGIAGGVRNLPWMFTATFVVLLVAQPLYGALVARLPRARFIPFVYHFFVANLALFWLLLALQVGTVWVARVFFVWVSVFNLFAVVVFWSFMADIFSSEQGKRLFGFIGAGGTAGALLGPVVTIWLSLPLGPVNLLLVAVAFLELAVLCVRRLERAAASAPAHAAPAAPEARIGGSAFAAVAELFGSPYLLGIAAWVSLLSFGGTFLYYQQAHIVSSTIHDPAQQTRLFAGIDLAVGLLTLASQSFVTGRFLRRFGVAPAAAALPAVYVLAFATLALAPGLAAVVFFQAVQRTMNFAISNPARQVFYTVVSREAKYKAKNLIDVVLFRGSDALYGWLFDSLQGLGLKLAAIAACAIPAALGWLVLSVALGRTQERRAAQGG